MGAEVSERIHIDAAPAVVYDLVADVARMGEWSPEATGAVRASAVLHAGDRFIGSNKRGPVRWWTLCTVLRAHRGEVLQFDVDAGPVPLSRWTYTFTEAPGGGTTVTETWLDRREGVTGLPVRLLGSLLIPGDRAAHNRSTMRATLATLKAVAEAAPAGEKSPPLAEESD
jgi:hypothetical protein